MAKVWQNAFLICYQSHSYMLSEMLTKCVRKVPKKIHIVHMKDTLAEGAAFKPCYVDSDSIKYVSSKIPFLMSQPSLLTGTG